jgi:serine/threonine-protein kinase RsbW
VQTTMTVKQWPAVLENISIITDYINDQMREAGLSEPKCLNAAVAVEEVVVNIIKHGYGEKLNGNIDLYIEKSPEQIAIHILDTAPMFNMLNTIPPNLETELNERPIGGLGIFMVKKMMDDIFYQREGNINHLILIINL